jgi:hypothetical protein
MTFPGRSRMNLLAPALTALGVTLVIAGLLSYTGPVEAGPPASQAPEVLGSLPPAPTSGPSASGVPGVPQASRNPFVVGPAVFPKGRVATRVVMAGMHIDIPVIKPPGGSGVFPLCNVAMYIKELGQPGQGIATYLYAHARAGMFLSLLTESKINNGRRMLGMEVDVYTSDNFEFKYKVYQIRRHQSIAGGLDDAVAATTEQLWLQTSEGPFGSSLKLMLVAYPVSFAPVDYSTAHPTPHPVVCS